MEKSTQQIRQIITDSRVFIGPPGVGKTLFKKKHPKGFIDPEDSINWKEMDQRHGLYPFELVYKESHARSEHELDWSFVWSTEILPRIILALKLQKNVIMGMITPQNVEAASRFLFGLGKRAQLILPPENTHYNWVWNDTKKRSRDWGHEFRSWKNTYWLRTLLRGLAGELGFPIVEAPTISKKTTARKMNCAMREALDKDGRKFAEMLFGRWAELDKNEEIVAMYTGTMLINGSIKLHCDRSAKVCGKKLHNCRSAILLSSDTQGHALSQWIAQDKLRPIVPGNKNAFIFFVGTLAPFHHGHLDLLDHAKEYLKSKGWNVIGGYASAFMNRKEERIGQLHNMLGPVEHRSTLLELGAMHSDWLMADLPVAHVLRPNLLAEGVHPAQQIAKRLREISALGKRESVTTFWVNGSDGYLDKDFFGKFAEHADSDALNPLRMLIIENRPGKNNWSAKEILRAVPKLSPFILRGKHHMKRPTSATAIRNAITSGNRIALREAVGLPLAESYLLGILHKYVSVK